MSGTSWLVLVAALGAIAWINWYFLFARRSVAIAGMKGGVQEIEILVKGGYEPGVVRVRRGAPVRLVFDRQENSSCSEEVVLGAFGVRRFLAPFKRTPVEFTPSESGTFDITCGMSMLHAKLVVED